MTWRQKRTGGTTVQEFQPYERPRIVSYGVWVFSLLLVLGLLGLVVLLTLTL